MLDVLEQEVEMVTCIWYTASFPTIHMCGIMNGAVICVLFLVLVQAKPLPLPPRSQRPPLPLRRQAHPGRNLHPMTGVASSRARRRKRSMYATIKYYVDPFQRATCWVVWKWMCRSSVFVLWNRPISVPIGWPLQSISFWGIRDCLVNIFAKGVVGSASNRYDEAQGAAL